MMTRSDYAKNAARSRGTMSVLAAPGPRLHGRAVTAAMPQRIAGSPGKKKRHERSRAVRNGGALRRGVGIRRGGRGRPRRARLL